MTCAAWAPTWAPVAGRGGRQDRQSPDDWSAAWKWILRRNLDRPLHRRQPALQRPDGRGTRTAFPSATGKVAMAENFLWSTYCLTQRGRRLGRRGHPGVQRHTDGAFNADTFRILKDTKNPDAAFTVLTTCSARGQGADPDVRRHPARRTASQRSSTPSSRASRYQPVDWQVAVDGIDHADDPNFESPIPALQLESVSRPFTKYQRSRWDSTPGLDMAKEIAHAEERAPGDLGQVAVSHGRTPPP